MLTIHRSTDAEGSTVNARTHLPVSQSRNPVDDKGNAMLPRHEVAMLAALLASEFAQSRIPGTLTVYAVDEYGYEIRYRSSES